MPFVKDNKMTREEKAVYGITFSSDIFPNISYEINSVVAKENKKSRKIRRND